MSEKDAGNYGDEWLHSLSFFLPSVWSAEHISWLKQGVKYVSYVSLFSCVLLVTQIAPYHHIKPLSRLPFIAPMAIEAGPRLSLSTRFRLSVRPGLYGRSGLSSKMGHNAMTCTTSVSVLTTLLYCATHKNDKN